MLVLYETCSSRTQKYLLFHNPVTWPTVEINDREELAALRTALALGHLLGRAVILPRFHCTLNGGGLGGPPPGSSSPASSSSARWSASASGRYRRRPVHRAPGSAGPPSTAGPPAEPDRECPLNGLLNVTAFDAQFANRYRENSFLRHPLVPEEVRVDRSLLLSVHAILRAEGGDMKDGIDDEKSRSRSGTTVEVSGLQAGESLLVNVSSLSSSTSSSSSSLSSSSLSSLPASSIHSAAATDSEDPLPKSPVTLSAADAVRMFGSISNRILELRSLYRIDLVFDDAASQANFDARARKAFQRGTYRQL